MERNKDQYIRSPILGMNLKLILGLLYLFSIFDKFEKGIFWVCDREIVGFVYKAIFWVCDKCLDLGIDIKNLVGCRFEKFFFFGWNWKFCLVAKKMDNKIVFPFNYQWVLMCLVIKRVQERFKKRINLLRIWRKWTWSIMF